MNEVSLSYLHAQSEWPSIIVVDSQFEPHSYPYSYMADPTKNALRAAIVEQDIGPEGAS